MATTYPQVNNTLGVASETQNGQIAKKLRGPQQCRKCTENLGQVVMRKGHVCPFGKKQREGGNAMVNDSSGMIPENTRLSEYGSVDGPVVQERVVTFPAPASVSEDTGSDRRTSLDVSPSNFTVIDPKLQLLGSNTGLAPHSLFLTTTPPFQSQGSPLAYLNATAYGISSPSQESEGPGLSDGQTIGTPGAHATEESHLSMTSQQCQNQRSVLHREAGDVHDECEGMEIQRDDMLKDGLQPELGVLRDASASDDANMNASVNNSMVVSEVGPEYDPQPEPENDHGPGPAGGHPMWGGHSDLVGLLPRGCSSDVDLNRLRDDVIDSENTVGTETESMWAPETDMSRETPETDVSRQTPETDVSEESSAGTKRKARALVGHGGSTAKKARATSSYITSTKARTDIYSRRTATIEESVRILYEKTRAYVVVLIARPESLESGKSKSYISDNLLVDPTTKGELQQLLKQIAILFERAHTFNKAEMQEWLAETRKRAEEMQAKKEMAEREKELMASELEREKAEKEALMLQLDQLRSTQQSTSTAGL